MKCTLGCPNMEVRRVRAPWIRQCPVYVCNKKVLLHQPKRIPPSVEQVLALLLCLPEWVPHPVLLAWSTPYWPGQAPPPPHPLGWMRVTPPPSIGWCTPFHQLDGVLPEAVGWGTPRCEQTENIPSLILRMRTLNIRCLRMWHRLKSRSILSNNFNTGLHLYTQKKLKILRTTTKETDSRPIAKNSDKWKDKSTTLVNGTETSENNIWGKQSVNMLNQLLVL